MNDLPGAPTPALTSDKSPASESPQAGDVLIRGLKKKQRFTLLDVVTTKFLSGPYDGFPAAAAAARARNARMIWQQNVDERGRPLGNLFPLSDQV
jgi:hypothetical protein